MNGYKKRRPNNLAAVSNLDRLVMRSSAKFYTALRAIQYDIAASRERLTENFAFAIQIVPHDETVKISTGGKENAAFRLLA